MSRIVGVDILNKGTVKLVIFLPYSREELPAIYITTTEVPIVFLSTLLAVTAPTFYNFAFWLNVLRNSDF